MSAFNAEAMTTTDPIVRLIQRSPISNERKTELLGEWHQRLEREQQAKKAKKAKWRDYGKGGERNEPGSGKR